MNPKRCIYCRKCTKASCWPLSLTTQPSTRGGGMPDLPSDFPYTKASDWTQWWRREKRKRNTRTPTLQKTNHGWLYANREWGQSSRQQPEPIQGERSPGCIRVLPQPRRGVGVLVCCRSVALQTQPADLKFEIECIYAQGGIYAGWPRGLLPREADQPQGLLPWGVDHTGTTYSLEVHTIQPGRPHQLNNA